MKNLLFTFLLALSTILSYGQSDHDKDAIHKIVEDMADAWTNADGPGFAKHFADEHDYFVWNGLYMSDLSKEDNAFSHQQLFNTQYKNTKHYAVVDKVRFVTENVAIALVMSAITEKDGTMPEHPEVLWSATLVKKDNQWKIVSFHNADIEILDTEESRKQSPVPIEMMYASWYRSAYASK